MQTMVYKGSDKLIWGIVLGVITFWLFAQSLVNVVPDIQASVAIPIETLNMAISLTGLFSGCFIAVAGGLADRFGRMKFTYIGFVLSIVGSACLLFAESAPLFIVGRVIQGLSAACIMPATLAIMKAFFDGAERQRALSFWSIGSWGGSGICSLAGGAIATYLGWRYIFVFSIICAIVGMLLLKGTPESKSEAETEKSSFDFMGLVFFVTGLIALNIFITKGSSFGWTSTTSIAVLALFAASAFMFFKVESSKKQKAFIDFSLFSNKPYSGATLSNFMLNAVAGTLFVANTYIQAGRGFTPFQTGMLSIGYLVAVLLMIRVGEKVLQKKGAKKPMIFGTVICGIGIGLMALTFLPDSMYVILVMLGFVFFGFGLGFYATPSTDTAISNAPSDKVGVASGIYKMASSLGGAFGVAISATVYTMLLPSGIAEAAFFGFVTNVVFCVISLVSIVVMVPETKMSENKKDKFLHQHQPA